MKKNRILKHSLACFVALLFGSTAMADNAWTWHDFGIDLVSILTDEQRVEKQAQAFGVVVADDGTLSQVATDAPNANVVLTGTYWNDHGWTSTTAVVRVEGPVQIDLGNCYYGAGDIKVTNAEGQTVASGALQKENTCWGQDHASIGSVKYTGGPTTLTITYGSYLPYIGVKAIEATSVDVAYALGDVECMGDVLPAGGTFAAGDSYAIPAKNFTLYKEGYTLTGWTDGQQVYAAGSAITLTSDITLTPVFTKNEVNLGDRTEPVTVCFDFQRQNGAPTVQWEGKTGLVWVAQAEVNGHTIDVPADLSTSPGKFANANWTDWCQINSGTTFTIPSCKEAVVNIESYSATSTTTIDGQTDYTANGNIVSYQVLNPAETIDIVIGDGSYFRYIQTLLPVPEQGFEPQTFDNAEASIVWNLNTVDEYATPNTLTPEGAYSLATVNVGDFTITVDAPSAGANKGVKMLKLQPTGGDNTSIEFIVKPYRGLTFTPTKVYAKVARFGTDGGTLNVTARNAEGEETSLATGLIPARNNKEQADDAKGSDPKYTTEFSFDIPATLATQESFSLIVTESGLATSKQWGIGDVHISGTVNGQTEDVAKYTVQVLANPADGGTVNCYPQGDTFDEGTELKLTATERFGYDFVNWTDAEGNTLSTEPVFVYTLLADAVLTANFKQVNTYELAYAVEGGANPYQVQPTPAPTVRDGKNMYEEGTEVTLAATGNAILAFNNWSSGETSSEIKVVMDKNYDLTASFSAVDYIVGWDFYLPGSNGRVADFYSTSDNDNAQLVLIDDEGNTAGWLDKSTQGQGGYESMAGAAVNWKKLGQYHYQTRINAKDFSNIRVKSQLLYNYNAYTHVWLQWSTDGQQWQTAGEVTMPGAKTVTDCDFNLPAEADHAETLYIRWMPDLNGPKDGSNAPDNDGTAISNIFVLADAAIYDDGIAPVLVSTVPADGATSASATGRIVLNFDEKVKVRPGALALLDDHCDCVDHYTAALEPIVSGKTIIFEYKGLKYDTEFYFSFSGDAVSDLAGNAMSAFINVVFKTMAKPKVQKALYDFIVPDDGSFKEALAAATARADQSKRFRIFVKQGDYIIPANQDVKVDGNDGKQYPDPKTSFGSPNVSIIGEGMEMTSIANQMPNDLSENPDAGKGGMANPLEGIRTSGVLYLTSGAQNTYFQDITLKTNTPDATGRNVVLVDGGNKTICKNVCLWAYQDTYVSDNARNFYYFEGGLLRGRTDFLCGSGDVFYNQVTLQMCEQGGFIAVPRDNVKYGYVFKDCTIKGEASNVNGNYYLGRPWTKGAEVYYIDTRMEAVPTAVGWHDMSADGCTRMCEWNSTSASGNPIDLSGRTTVLGGNPNNPWMTEEEAQEIGNMANMFGDWDPRQHTEQAPVPTNVRLSGNAITWDNSDYVLCWAVVKDGKVVAFTTEPAYTVDDASAQWAVRAANEMGGLSEPAAAIDPAGINDVLRPADNIQYFNLQGMRVSGNAAHGIVIANGKKVVK